MYHGGDGIIRDLEFLRPLTVSILSERRAVQPFGILGGLPAARGVNLWVKRGGRVVSLGGKATVQVEAGDRVQILTPGGGGCGPPEQEGGTERSPLAALVASLAAARQRVSAGEASAPVRDGGSVQRYRSVQESA